MTEREVFDAVCHGEAGDWEFKSARGGVPGSLWETYSAMANSDGGTIVLGVTEKDGVFQIDHLDKHPQYRKSIFDTANNPGKVSLNLLSDESVSAVPVDGKVVLVIRVPRAARRQRPVFVGQNPLTGTYRRSYEGDYHCTPDEVGRMLADQSEEPADARVVEYFTLDDLHQDSLTQYRYRFGSRSPSHPWLSLDNKGLLEKLGGWRRERRSGREGLTVAGLLMFGKDEAIRDPEAIPQYQVDYREKTADDPRVRWTDRITVDGQWVANLFQFYQRVIIKLTSGLRVPFQLEPDLFRKDDTPVHEAIREALVNALVHADYRGQGGVVIERYRSRIEMSNPGTLLVSYEQLLQGAVSECRNKSLQLMFQMIGAGDKAGSGFDKIRQGWKSEHWRQPYLFESVGPNRVILDLPMVSLLPQESLDRLQAAFGAVFRSLSPVEVQTLVTADLEGKVSNARMQLFCDDHPADLTRMFRSLVDRGFLELGGQKRTYRLPTVVSSPHSTDLPLAPLPPNGGSSPQTGVSSPQTGVSSPQTGVAPPARDTGGDQEQMAAEPGNEETDQVLLDLAREAREKPRLPQEQIRGIIRSLCRDRYLTAVQIGHLMDRDPEKVRDRHLSEMVRTGELETLHIRETHPDQAYRTRD